MISRESDREHHAGPVKAEDAAESTTPESGRTDYESTRPPRAAHRTASFDRGVQIAAARLRLVTDSQLGLETPDWVRKLAAEKPRRASSSK